MKPILVEEAESSKDIWPLFWLLWLQLQINKAVQSEKFRSHFTAAQHSDNIGSA